MSGPTQGRPGPRRLAERFPTHRVEEHDGPPDDEAILAAALEVHAAGPDAPPVDLGRCTVSGGELGGLVELGALSGDVLRYRWHILGGELVVEPWPEHVERWPIGRSLAPVGDRSVPLETQGETPPKGLRGDRSPGAIAAARFRALTEVRQPVELLVAPLRDGIMWRARARGSKPGGGTREVVVEGLERAEVAAHAVRAWFQEIESE